MRLIALLLFTTYLFSSDFPEIFSSAGDEVYEDMQKYQQIKELSIYKDRPEILEAYCIDANNTMQRGFSLDKAKDDPELSIDKGMIRSYAKELRVLSSQNQKIRSQLKKDIYKLSEQGEFKTLKKISDAGFVLSEKMMQAIKEDEKKEKLARNLPVKKNVPVVATQKVHKEVLPTVAVHIPLPTPIPVPIPTPPVPDIITEEKREPVKEEKLTQIKKKPTELEYYQLSLANFKDELYALRESTESNLSEQTGLLAVNETQTACLNDITAINYWMIKVLENKNDSCLLRDAIKQMKSYDKASMNSCGRASMRYVEWHGRIKPYVGKRLFEAEAGCTN